ncbi:LLM class flavin-dependent oxidoreductase [Streptomyces sp. NPDC088350]|uniref:LLM class flavin-dependent oxidoreductase n=1 Tax=Streptomyces sp. NPDC088350 TaxID=3365854 RepID=UPI0038134CF9
MTTSQETRRGDDTRLCGLSIAVGVGTSWEKEGWRAVVEAARTAELCGFHSIWLTGGDRTVDRVRPNPALVAAAVSVSTQNIRLRVEMAESGHDPLRVAEDWSVVDNLSDSRVELLYPAEAADRTRAQLLSTRDLWNGKDVLRAGPGENEYNVRIYPAPQQAAPTFWLADGDDGLGRELSAEMNTGVYIVDDLSFDQIAERIALLQEQFRAVNGNPGRVAVAAGTALSPEDIQGIHALGVEEVVHRLDIEAVQERLTEAVTELAHANDLVSNGEIVGPR